jgi:hypothetical protein
MPNFSIMFNCLTGGVIKPIKWGEEQLQPDRSIIVLDESNMNLYLWHGAKQGLVARRTALRQAESLKGHGYSIDQGIIGREISEIKEIDARKVGKVQKDTDLNNELKNLLNKKHNELENHIVTFDMSAKSFSATQPASKPKAASKPKPKATPKAETRPEPKPEPKSEPTPKEKPKPEPKTTSKPKPKPKPDAELASKIQEELQLSDADLRMKAKVSFVLMAILEHYDDIWISKKKDNQYSVEMMDGPICTFSVTEGKLKFSSGSFSGIDPNIKTSVKKLFVEFNKLLK